MTMILFVGVLCILSGITLAMSIPMDLESEWGHRDRLVFILLTAGSALTSVGIIIYLAKFLLGGN